MTNKEKYLKDGVDSRYFATELYRFLENNKDSNIQQLGLINTFLSLPANPTLTEVEKIILMNIDKKYTYIARTYGDLWAQVGEETENSDCDVMTPFNHLFQFIKERRRIRDSRTFERRINMIKNNWLRLDENEKRRAKMCIENIKDKIEAIENELNEELSYRSYIAEKIESVCWDANVIKRISKMETEEEQ